MNRFSVWYSEERDKLRGMTFREAFSYIFSYYWLHILIVSVLVAVPIILLTHVMYGNPEYRLYVIFANTRTDAGNDSELWKDYLKFSGSEDAGDEVHFDAQCYIDTSRNLAGDHYFTTFIVLAETGTLDLITMSLSDLEILAQSGRILNLRDPICERLIMKYGDRLIYATDPESGERYPVGVDLSSSLLVTKYGVYAGDCAAGLGVNTSDMDEIMTFLDFLMEGETQ